MTAPSEAGASTPCSLQSRAVDEPLAGTAPTARAWIVIEHPGPWGRDAVADSDLPPAVRAHLAQAKAHQVTVLLARRPERRGGGEAAAGHRVWVARGAAGAARMRTGQLSNLDVLATWDLAAIAEGTLPALDRVMAEPLLLVCTHGRRDACCAVSGRAMVAGLLEASPGHSDQVWECSHVGGHRLAPVTVTLPDGMVHGRLSPDDGARLLTAMDEGRVLPDLLRGRASLPAPLQAAEVAVRLVEGIDVAGDLDALAVRDGRALPVPTGWPAPAEVLVEVRHRDGRAWRVPVSHDDLGVRRAESCGKDPVDVTAWIPGDVVPAPAWPT